MNTAQVSVELILAGILAICSFVLPFAAGNDFDQALTADNMIFIAALGAAYLFGVVFDKLADVLLNPFEKYKRLQRADEYLKKYPKYKNDPFPQNELEYRLRKEKDGRLDWMDSLKSRIRTSRELAVFGLPATAGIVIYLRTLTDCKAIICEQNNQHWFVGVNIILMVIAVLTARRNQGIPNTDDLAQDSTQRASQMTLAQKKMLIQPWTYYLILLNSITAITLNTQSNTSIAIFGFGGAFITLLGFWSWNTITQTYLKFIAREMPYYLADMKK